MEKIKKKSLFTVGLFLNGLLLSGLPAYLISLYGSTISRWAIFFLMWILFSIPFGLVILILLVQWYKEKERTNS